MARIVARRKLVVSVLALAFVCMGASTAYSSIVLSGSAGVARARSLVRIINATRLCSYTCNPNCPPGFSGTQQATGYERSYNSCSFWFYCTNNCLDSDDFGPATFDALAEIVENGSLDEVGVLLTETSKLRINEVRKSVQLADCTGHGVAVNLPIGSARLQAIQEYLAHLHAAR